MAIIRFFDIVTPTGWTAEQKAFATSLCKARGKNPRFTRALSLNLIGRMVGKTPGQMNRFNTEAGFAPTYGPRKKRVVKRKRTKRAKIKRTTPTKRNQASKKRKPANYAQRFGSRCGSISFD